MLFAQTELNSTPLGIDPMSGTAASSSLWWMIPLAFAIAGFAWYVRRQWNRPGQKLTTKPVSRAKPTGKEGIKAPAMETSAATNSTKSRDVVPTKKAAKKSKKDRSIGERQSKTIVVQPTLTGDSKSVSSSDLAPSLPLSNPPTTTTPVTTTAIFEPLRDVGAKRRRAAFSPQNELGPRDEDAASKPTGGKFERTVAPKTATRSAASRWPTTATQQVRSNAVEPQRPQALSLPPTTPASKPVPLPATTPAPANGLKSFVSKVKSSVDTDKVSAPKDVEPVSFNE